MAEPGMEVGRQKFNFLWRAPFTCGESPSSGDCSTQSFCGFIELSFFLVEVTVSLGITIRLYGPRLEFFFPNCPVMSQLTISVLLSSE